MIEKLDTELLESNRRYYERELARPKYDVYTKVRNIDGRASSVEAATFCNSLETFLTTYKTVSETLEAGKYLDGSSSQKRAFINIFSLYAAAAEAAGKITKVRARSNQNKNGQIEIKVDFSQGTYSLAEGFRGDARFRSSIFLLCNPENKRDLQDRGLQRIQ